MFPFTEWLEEQPEAGYYAGLQGLPPALQRYFQGQYGNFYNEYLGALGRQTLSGQTPDLRFTDFLAQNPFTSRYTAMPPQWRGQDSARLSPKARWFTS